MNSVLPRTLLVSVLVASYAFALFAGHGMIGYQFQVSAGRVSVSAASDPLWIGLSIAGMVLFGWLLARRETDAIGAEIAPLWQRFAAFATDSFFLSLMLGGLTGFVPIALEAARTRQFEWQFFRSYFVPADVLNIGMLLFGAVAYGGYFVLFLMKGKQTFGCWVFRLATVDESRRVAKLRFHPALRRIWLEAKGLLYWFRTITRINPDGTTWYDRESRLTVVRY